MATRPGPSPTLPDYPGGTPPTAPPVLTGGGTPHTTPIGPGGGSGSTTSGALQFTGPAVRPTGGTRPGIATRPIIEIAGEGANASEQQQTVAAYGALLPTIYGQVQTGPMIGAVSTIGSDLVLLLIWALGEVNSIVSVLLEDGETPTGVTFTHYVGTTSQTADSTLQTAIPGYMDDLTFTSGGVSGGYAYSVARIPPSEQTGFPRFVATIQGVKVYDPRITSTVYSDNPALCLAHYLTDDLHGLGRTVDWTSVGTAADECDDVMSDATKRRRIGVMLRNQASPQVYIEALRTYAGCYIYEQSGTFFFVPNRPLVSFSTLTASDILANSLSLQKKNLRDTPTVVTVKYTSRADTIYTEQETEPVMVAGVSAGTVPWRESVVDLPGIFTAAQARREAIERLNHIHSQDLICSFQLFDEGLELNPGDGIEITHPIGLSATQFRLISRESIGPGRYQCEAVAYNASVYSNEVTATEYTYGGDALASPTVVPDVQGLTLGETVYQLANGEYATRIDISWTALSYSYLDSYEVVVSEGATNIWEFTPPKGQISVATGPVKEGVEYTVKVRARSSVGVVGDWSTDMITPNAKSAPPSNVSQVNVTSLDADVVLIEWLPATDLDLIGYEVRRGATWATAVLIDFTQGLSTVVDELPLGTHFFQVRAKDSVGNYSVTSALYQVDIVVPNPVTNLTGFEAGGTVYISWSAAASRYIKHYEVRYGLQSGYSWATATLGDKIDGLRFVDGTIAEGDYRFEVRTIDNAGRSSTGVTVDVTITSDASAFVADNINFADEGAPTLTNMRQIDSYARFDGSTYYITDNSDTIASMFGSAMSTYTNALPTYHSSVSSEYLSATHDAGALLSGDWVVSNSDITALGGTITKQLELSEDDVSYDTYTAMSGKGTYRYARVRVTTTTTNTAQVKVPPLRLRISVTPRTQNGLTSVTSNPTTVNLTGTVSFYQDIQATASNTAFRMAIVDNLTTGASPSFDLYVFDDAGSAASSDVYWRVFYV